MDNELAATGRWRPNLFLPLFSVCVIILGACNSLPPVAPVDDDSEYFDPRYLTWQPATETSPLNGDWFRDGELYLEFGRDSLYIGSSTPASWAVDESGAYYRLTYQLGSRYYTIYLARISPDSLRILYSDRPVDNPALVDSIPASGDWLVLTNRIFWQSRTLPSEMLGNWHVSNGVMEVTIGQDQVVLDSAAWSLDSVQSNRGADKLVLSRKDSTIALYYRYATPLTMQLLPAGSTENIQDRNGYVLGNWRFLKKWYDILEVFNWRDGARFEYNYEFTSLVSEVSAATVVEWGITTRDSLEVTRTMTGKMNVAVSGEISGNEQGALYINVQFDISEDRGRYFYSQVTYSNFVGRRVDRLADSSWAGPRDIAETNYSVIMVNDTLWSVTDTGREFISPRTVDLYSLFSLHMFVYPFDPPLQHFPDSMGLVGPLKIPTEPLPVPITFSLDGAGLVLHPQSPRYGEKHSYSTLTANRGLENVHYYLKKYNGRDFLPFFPPSGENPYHREFKFKCSLDN
ncbi:MAG: hypothetical protein FVQ81_07110 [Candidatus Glassbacteria bacterium]|nr:hypothetical protein [Candidatus Glassbacteria bacterium]